MRGLLLAGDTERSAALRHEIPIAIGDPLLFAEVDGRSYVLTTRLERDRVQREIELRAVRGAGINEAIVPADFPLGLGDRLREEGIVLTVDDAAVELRRRTKSPVELEGIRVAQHAAEAGMAAASQLLARAERG